VAGSNYGDPVRWGSPFALMLNELIDFAVENAGKNYANFSRQQWANLLQQHSLIVIKEKNEINGFGVYDNRATELFFYCIVKKSTIETPRAVAIIKRAIDNCLPKKPIRWLDEKRKRIVQWDLQ